MQMNTSVPAASLASLLALSGLLLSISYLTGADAVPAPPLIRASSPHRALLASVTPRQATGSTRLDGTGVAGQAIQELLDEINVLSASTPRVGANAAISTNAEGADQAQRRTAATELQTLPLRSTGQSSGGAAAIDPDRTETTLNARSAAVAKGIVDDNGNFGSTFGSASTTKGLSETIGRTGLPTGSITRGSSTTSTGEKATLSLGELPRDGAAAQSTTIQQGLGERVRTQLQSASLSATALDDKADDKDRFSGSFYRTVADAADRPDLSTTRNLGVASNTEAALNTASTANRYGYTQAQPSATVRSDNTESGRVRIAGGDFGTGFVFGSAVAQSSTYLSG